MGFSVRSAQFCCEPKTALKIAFINFFKGEICCLANANIKYDNGFLKLQ